MFPFQPQLPPEAQSVVALLSMKESRSQPCDPPYQDPFSCVSLVKFSAAPFHPKMKIIIKGIVLSHSAVIE